MKFLIIFLSLTGIASAQTHVDGSAAKEIYNQLDAPEVRFIGITVGGWPIYTKSIDGLACSYSHGPRPNNYECMLALNEQDIYSQTEDDLWFGGEIASRIYNALLIEETRYQGVTLGGWPAYNKVGDYITCRRATGPRIKITCSITL